MLSYDSLTTCRSVHFVQGWVLQVGQVAKGGEDAMLLCAECQFKEMLFVRVVFVRSLTQ